MAGVLVVVVGGGHGAGAVELGKVAAQVVQQRACRQTAVVVGVAIVIVVMIDGGGSSSSGRLLAVAGCGEQEGKVVHGGRHCCCQDYLSRHLGQQRDGRWFRDAGEWVRVVAREGRGGHSGRARSGDFKSGALFVGETGRNREPRAMEKNWASRGSGRGDGTASTARKEEVFRVLTVGSMRTRAENLDGPFHMPGS